MGSQKYGEQPETSISNRNGIPHDTTGYHLVMYQPDSKNFNCHLRLPLWVLQEGMDVTTWVAQHGNHDDHTLSEV